MHVLWDYGTDQESMASRERSGGKNMMRNTEVRCNTTNEATHSGGRSRVVDGAGNPGNGVY